MLRSRSLAPSGPIPPVVGTQSSPARRTACRAPGMAMTVSGDRRWNSHSDIHSYSATAALRPSPISNEVYCSSQHVASTAAATALPRRPKRRCVTCSATRSRRLGNPLRRSGNTGGYWPRRDSIQRSPPGSAPRSQRSIGTPEHRSFVQTMASGPRSTRNSASNPVVASTLNASGRRRTWRSPTWRKTCDSP